MTKEQIIKNVKEIKGSQHDAEAAHSMEDSLYLEFVEYVATLPIPIAEKAKEVLKTQYIEFSRWCA
jgi:hypothetical protein